MKRIIIMILLPLLFLFLSSFSFQQDVTRQQAVEDSIHITVTGKMEPSKLVIDDTRNSEALAVLLQSTINSDKELVSSVKQINNSLTGWITTSLERDGESAMDFLERKSGWTIERINNAIYRKQKINSTSLLSSIGIALVLGYFMIQKNWQNPIRAVFCAVGFLVVIIGIYFIVHTLGTHSYPDYTYLENLLKLSG